MRMPSLRSMLGFAAVGMITKATIVDVDPRLQSRLDGRILQAVSSIVDSASSAGLESEPLVQYALEASLKARQPEQIVTHVSRYWSAMKRARAALGPGATPAEVTAGANALRAGIDIRQLERLRSARQGQRYAGALNALSSLVRRGVSADTAATVIVDLVLASASDEQISLLQSEIERDIAAGTPAGLATTARGEGLEKLIRETDNSGLPGAALPSARGTTRSADPLARPVGGSAVGNKAPGEGPRPPAPRGKDNKRP